MMWLGKKVVPDGSEQPLHSNELRQVFTACVITRAQAKMGGQKQYVVHEPAELESKEDSSIDLGNSSFGLPGSGDSRGSCLKNMRCFIPPDYRHELVQLFKLAGPVIISQLMVFMISFVSTVFCGHLGKTELAAVALAISVVNVTGISIGTGLSLTCDTLISQTYGSGNLKRVGVILQRGVLILLLACFPCWAILINTEPLLLAVKQSPEVASIAQLYVKIFMPALPAAFMYQLQGRYLQNQGIIWPQVVAGVIANILNAIINYVFLYCLDLGVAGSAAANAISQYLLAVILFAYICCRGLHKATWGGWTLDCLQEWGPFVQLAIPSMLMLCLEWWIFEIGGFLAGVISETELGAHSIPYQLATLAYMGVAGGVLRGAGKQLIGALCNLVGYYFIGFPIGVSLMFAANMGIALVRAGVQIKEENEMVEMKVKDSNQNQYQVSTTASSGEIAEVDHAYQEAHIADQNKSTTTTVGNVLSVTQLVLWRGLILLLMVIILVAGIIADIFLTRLLK
ncbi:hypothetical protein EPR50_G00020460 [Perca flavescens]|uniref:Multidrug and toxin extrusion protein n=1 Tax=Perca flavescens TaxID=8167 RepID=A0A484DPL3_PERFV|nr:hypothetical protein EPR50_G00020460 [Perca flavescens]